MGRFQSCKALVERSLRRAFYDGVLEMYEGHGSPETVTAVTLEGTLTLTINRVETLLIRLNEIAQRAGEISVEQEDSTRAAQEQSQKSVHEKDQESAEKKRKWDEEDEKVDLKPPVKQQKCEIIAKETKREADALDPTLKPSDVLENFDTGQPTTDEKVVSERTQSIKPITEKSESCSSPIVEIKKEPQDTPADCISEIVPGPSSTSRTESTIIEVTRDNKTRADDLLEVECRGMDLSLPVQVKKEPAVESIVIEDDDDDDDDEVEDLSRQNWGGTMQQASPIHSLWHKRPQGPRHHHHSSHHFSNSEHSLMRTYPNPHSMDTSDPHQMSVLLERNDCPMCGEVLHTRKELSSHLHAHRHALRVSCSVCRANTLTVDALFLHLSTMHSPRLLPIAPAMTSDALLSQALVPALPYTPSPMSAIASLVSMAACQAGPSSAAFLAGGPGLGMTSLMGQFISYRGLVPCPVCQMLCSSKQHLAAHLALMHGDPTSLVGRGEEDAGDDLRSDSRQDSDGEGSSNFSCFDCSIGFVSQTAFTQHCMLQHNTTSVVSQGSCSVCHRAFHTWKALHSHYLSVHGITSFCDRCKMGFVSNAELKTHYDSAHNSDARSLAFTCDICNKGFYSQSQCSAHKRSHISEKSFACQVCGSAFFKRGDLSKHFRTVHAPNRVFACRFCGKRGTRMDNMRSHVKSHGKHMTRDEVLSFIEEVSPN